MLIQALYDYYDILKEKGVVVPSNYSVLDVTYKISLRLDGTMDDIIDARTPHEIEAKKGKVKTVLEKTPMTIMRRSQKTCIDANFVEHRPLYIFGLNEDKAKLQPNDKKTIKSHEAFVQKNLQSIEGVHSPIVDAYRNFIQTWNPENECENALLLDLGKSYSVSNYVFCLSGHPHILLHEDTSLKQKWEAVSLAQEQSDCDKIQCGITGNYEEISRLHNKITGFPGGLATGNVLIGFNNPSELSYDKEQSFNSNISKLAMERYTTSLNYLLKSKMHRHIVEDMTVVHFAMSRENKYDTLLNALAFDVDDKMDADETDNALSDILQDIKQGQFLRDVSVFDPSVDFYILGIKPNAARLSLKFIYHKSFGELLKNTMQHQEDMRISEKEKHVPLYWITKELVSPKSTNQKVSPALVSKLFESILNGYAYPTALLQTVVQRIKADQDTETNAYVKINATRVGLIKAYLNRNARLHQQKEEFTLALDRENTTPAYLCGRLFAVLEKLQKDASGGNLNRTIKDSYFASASSRPAIVFPKLIRLAQNHLNKAKYSGYANATMGEIMNKLSGAFPDVLSLTDQGKFVLGYYQQAFEKHQKNEEKEGEE